MVRRTKDEALETRHRILDVAEQVFYERGVTRTSLADIAEAAGVTRGAIYWHFTDKADLFCSMVARATMPMETPICQTDHRGAADPLASIRGMMIGILRHASEDPQARRVFHIVYHKCEHIDEMRPVWQRFNEMRVRCLARIEEGLCAAMRKGRLPRTLNARRAATGLRALLDGLVSHWVLDPACRPRETEVEALVDLFLNALNVTSANRATKASATANPANPSAHKPAQSVRPPRRAIRQPRAAA
ncbi:MAG: TetR family transcriptional regulator [Betaproteobacteria bacterium]|nr:TetR family transcriptional regulator [Betaproteobacteria bacterium]